MLQAAGGDTGVASVVEVLDVAGVCVLVVGHDLAAVPASITGGGSHGVENDGLRNLTREERFIIDILSETIVFISCSINYPKKIIITNYLWTVELVVSVGHALVQPLQGSVGGVTGLLNSA